ncbi:condensation domain-containing protein, partial [Kitasatospora sp. NPDC036755]|uniref:condensation domain-containing protein n=1 Tax=Kitasatospora sp. NPDC036755 TaxID=3154600 RepID=UPI0033F9C91A
MKQSRIEEILPLSPFQEGLYFHAEYDKDVPDVYNVQYVFDLEGPVSSRALREAARYVLTRHSSLRAGFHQRKNGQLVQIVTRDIPLDWQETDLSGLPPAEREPALHRHLAAERERRFDLASPPLIRFALIRLGADRHAFAVMNHHILLDGWSMPVLMSDLFLAYAQHATEAITPLAGPPARHYRDYLSWLREQDGSAAETAWREALTGLDEPTLVAGATGAPVSRLERVSTTLGPELTHHVTEQARALGLTLNTVLQGAWALLLAGLTGRDDLVFGATVSGRPPELPGVEEIVGLLINTVPIRVRLRPDETLNGLFRRIQEEQAALLGHHHLGLVDVHRAAGLDRLFDTVLLFENYPFDADDFTKLGTGLQLRGIQAHDGAHYPLRMVVLPSATDLTLHLDHSADLFDHASVGVLAGRLVRTLEAWVAAPGTP